MYNYSELWNLTKTKEKQIDAFQRKLLKQTINITYPKKISNEKLNKITKNKPWSKSIKRRRIRFFGHFLRLHPSTPIKQALTEVTRDTHKRKPGRPKTTWIHMMRNYLDSFLKITGQSDKIFLETATVLAHNRLQWNLYLASSKAWKAVCKGVKEEEEEVVMIEETKWLCSSFV